MQEAYKIDNIISFPALGIIEGGNKKDDFDEEVISKTVFPIKDPADVIRFQKYLLDPQNTGKIKKTNRRNYILFTLGIYLGLRVSDLVRLKVKDFISPDGTPLISRKVREKKTRKVRELYYPKDILSMVCSWISDCDFGYEDYIFPSNKGGCVTPHYIGDMLRLAGKALNYPLPISSHSMRKTWAYSAYMQYKDDPYVLSTLQRALGHTSMLTTLRYIGIEDTDVARLYTDVSRTSMILA